MTPPTDRRRARRILLAWSAPLVALTLAAGAWLVTVYGINAHAISRSDGGHHAEAAELFAAVDEVNLVAEDIPCFNRGTQLFARSDYPGARDEFAAALRLAPPERSCRTRFNLVRTLEVMGDEADTAGDRDRARARWQEGLDAVRDGQCPAQAPHDAGTRLEAARHRLERKLGEQPGSTSSSTSPSSSPASSPASSSSSSSGTGSSTSQGALSPEQEEELRRKSSSGASERARRSGSSGPPAESTAPVDKPW